MRVAVPDNAVMEANVTIEPAPRHHSPRRRLRAQESAGQIDVERPTPLLEGEIDEPLAKRDCSGGHQCVDHRMSGVRRLEEAIDRVGVGDIDLDGDGVPAADAMSRATVWAPANRSPMTTEKPRAAAVTAISRPIPLAPPVTTIVGIVFLPLCPASSSGFLPRAAVPVSCRDRRPDLSRRCYRVKRLAAAPGSRRSLVAR